MKKNQLLCGRYKSSTYYKCVNSLQKKKYALLRSIIRERQKRYKQGYLEYKTALRILEERQWKERDALYRSYANYIDPYILAKNLLWKLSGYWAKSKNRYDKKIHEIDAFLTGLKE